MTNSDGYAAIGQLIGNLPWGIAAQFQDHQQDVAPGVSGRIRTLLNPSLTREVFAAGTLDEVKKRHMEDYLPLAAALNNPDTPPVDLINTALTTHAKLTRAGVPEELAGQITRPAIELGVKRGNLRAGQDPTPGNVNLSQGAFAAAYPDQAPKILDSMADQDRRNAAAGAQRVLDINRQVDTSIKEGQRPYVEASEEARIARDRAIAGHNVAKTLFPDDYNRPPPAFTDPAAIQRDENAWSHEMASLQKDLATQGANTKLERGGVAARLSSINAKAERLGRPQYQIGTAVIPGVGGEPSPGFTLVLRPLEGQATSASPSAPTRAVGPDPATRAALIQQVLQNSARPAQRGPSPEPPLALEMPPLPQGPAANVEAARAALAQQAAAASLPSPPVPFSPQELAAIAQAPNGQPVMRGGRRIGIVMNGQFMAQ